MVGSITVLRCMKCGRCDSVCGNGAIARIDGIATINHEKCNECNALCCSLPE